ncbi:MAG TPA: hypothetical protein VLA59_05145, partial [Patescibacteria group bacterium]|nr:hypothetical protein [Patescibacteria group bacterium]
EAWQMPLIAGTRSYNLELVDEATGSALNIGFDLETRGLSLLNVVRDESDVTLPGVGCPLTSEELGQLNARTTVIEVSFQCDAVEVPGLGAVPITGTLVVERLEWPE